MTLLPFANLDIKTCNQAIFIINIARSFKLGQLIEGDKYLVKF